VLRASREGGPTRGSDSERGELANDAERGRLDSERDFERVGFASLLEADFGPSFLSLPIQKQVRESVGAALRLHKIQSNPPAVCQFDGHRWGNHVQEEEGQSQKANQDAELAGPA